MNSNEKSVLIRNLDQHVMRADDRKERALTEGAIPYAFAQAACDDARDLRSDLRRALGLDDDDSPEADL